MADTLKGTLNVRASTQKAIDAAWEEWTNALGLEGAAAQLFRDLVLEHSFKVDSALPPGFDMELSPNKPTNVSGSPCHAYWETSPLQKVFPEWEAKPFLKAAENYLFYEVSQDAEVGEIVRQTDGSFGVWVECWLWVHEDEVEP